MWSSSSINNVNKNGNNNQRIANLNGFKQNINGNHDRPMLPPPPIPNNQISDLQQIQQQMIKKKLTDINIIVGVFGKYLSLTKVTKRRT